MTRFEVLNFFIIPLNNSDFNLQEKQKYLYIVYTVLWFTVKAEVLCIAYTVLCILMCTYPICFKLNRGENGDYNCLFGT